MGKTPGIAWAGMLLTGIALSGCESSGQKSTALPSTTPRVAANSQTPGTGWNNQPRGWNTSTVDPATRTGSAAGQPAGQTGSTFGGQPISGFTNTTNPNSTVTPSSSSLGTGSPSGLTPTGTRTTDDGYPRPTTNVPPSFDSGRSQGSTLQPSGGSLMSPSTTSGLSAPSGIPSSSQSWPSSSTGSTTGLGSRVPSLGSSSGSSSSSTVPTLQPGQSDQ